MDKAENFTAKYGNTEQQTGLRAGNSTHKFHCIVRLFGFDAYTTIRSNICVGASREQELSRE